MLGGGMLRGLMLVGGMLGVVMLGGGALGGGSLGGGMVLGGGGGGGRTLAAARAAKARAKMTLNCILFALVGTLNAGVCSTEEGG